MGYVKPGDENKPMTVEQQLLALEGLLRCRDKLALREQHQKELRELASKERYAIEDRYHVMNEDGEYIITNQDIDCGSAVIPCGSLGYAYPNFKEQLYGGTVWHVECLVAFDHDLSPDLFDVISYEEYKARSITPRYVQVTAKHNVSKGDVIYLE